MSNHAPLLHALLKQTKLGVERRRLMHWLNAPQRLLAPRPLLEGSPNPGLTNQILSLIGVIILANLSAAKLVLPPFTEPAPLGTILPFDGLFDITSFKVALGGTVQFAADHSALLNATHQHHNLGQDRGWFFYKASESFPQLMHIETRVLQALRPSRGITSEAQRYAALLRLPSGKFGCIHPRIERDMLKAIRFNRAGELPPLSHYFGAQWATQFPTIRRHPQVFVPVSLDVRKQDAERLRRGTSWNGTVARTGHLTRSAGSQTLAALLDFTICNSAAWFMGWSGSTYSRLLGAKATQRGRPHFVACPSPVRTCRVRTSSDTERRYLLSHSFCLALTVQLEEARKRKGLRDSRAMPQHASSSLDAEDLHVDQHHVDLQRFLRNHSMDCTFGAASSEHA